MDGTQHASVDIAIGKAMTANNFKRPTKALQDGIAQGGIKLRILGQPGVLSSQDAEIAMAGAAAAK